MPHPHVNGSDVLIPQPAQRLPDLRQAVAAVAPSKLSGFFEEMQQAFTRAGEEDSVIPIRMFYRRWAVMAVIERRPGVAARLRQAERDMNSPAPHVRDEAIRAAGDIVQAAHREVEGG